MTRRDDDRPAGRGGARTTHFGYRTVGWDEKSRLVRGVFDSVADRYDLMNDLMSGGIHRLWKNAFVDWLNPQPGISVLDVGGGTGDIAFRVLERQHARAAARGGEEAEAGSVVVSDINAEMLQVGRDRAIDRGLLSGLSWLCADAERLPLPDACMDAYTIAFCIRNVTDVPAALAEARRVLKPGGRFLCLEFSQVETAVLEKAYDIYSFSVLPRLGEWVADDAESYRYLAESIRQFPPQDQFAAMIEDAGLEQVRWRNLSGGIAAIHSAWRL